MQLWPLKTVCSVDLVLPGLDLLEMLSYIRREEPDDDLLLQLEVQ